MKEENNGCLNFAGFVAFVIALYIWVTNVETVNIVEQIPPPQDSWDVVYPQFRDEVSAQLLNTQMIVGSVLDDTEYIKTQNADLQYSVNLLLDNLGIMKKESYEESIRQRNEQRITAVLSLFVGWLLGAFVTKDSMAELRKRLSQRKKKGTIKSQSPDVAEKKVEGIQGSILEHVKKDPITNILPNDLIQRLPKASQSQLSRSCPKCGLTMEIQTAPIGQHIGKQFFVCPNYKHCHQVFPAS